MTAKMKTLIATAIIVIVIAIAITWYVYRFRTFRISKHAHERAKERGVPVSKMLHAARNGEKRGGRRGRDKKCADGACAVVSPMPASLLKRRTILTTYFDT